MKQLDIIGNRYGHLVVLRKDESYTSVKHPKYICQCDCGNIKSLFRDAIVYGRSTSCGCQMNKGKKGINKKHGMSGTRIFHEWTSMKRRCSQKSKNAKTYHDRGITVCPEWMDDFESFYNWAMENGYSDDLSIDRINNDLGYSPSNCRWIKLEDQQGNKTNTVKIWYNGKEHCLRTLCREIDFPYKIAHQRYLKLKNKNEVIDPEILFYRGNLKQRPK